MLRMEIPKNKTERKMKSLLKFGLVLIVFGLVMSGLTTMLIRANAVPETAVKKVSAAASTPTDSTKKP